MANHLTLSLIFNDAVVANPFTATGQFIGWGQTGENTVNGPQIGAITVAPNAGLGVAANLGSMGLQTNGQIWGKTGALATDWTNLTTGAAVNLAATNMRTLVNLNPAGAPLVVYRIDVPDGAGNTDITPVTDRIQVILAFFVKTGGVGGAGDTVQFFSASGPVTPVADLNGVAVGTVSVISAGFDLASGLIPAGGLLRATAVAGAGNNAVAGFILACRAP
jgi:hypothetical protein